MSNLLQKASIITTPTAYDTGKILSVKPVQYYGPELVTNGDFATDSDWTKGTGWNISGGKGNGTSASGDLTQTISIAINKTYRVNYTISNYSSGVFRIVLGAYVAGTNRAANGTYTDVLTVTNANSNLLLYLAADISAFTGSIDNVSVKEVLNADFDFTRGSSATRVGSNGLIQDVASNLPRIDYTGGVGSWKFEPQRTNYQPYSTDFSVWGLSGATVNINYGLSPDGLNNSTLITEGTGSAQHRILKGSPASSGIYTLSCFVKNKVGNRQAYIDMGAVTGFFNFDTKTMFSAAGTTSVESWSNGWYRISITSSSNITPTVTFLGIGKNNNETFQGDGSSAIEFFAPQLEQGSYATSYIPTSGSATTRSADAANNAGSSDLINSTEGVLYAEFSTISSDAVNSRYIGISNGSVDNRIAIRQLGGSTNQVGCFVVVGGSVQANLISTINLVNFNKIAVKYKANDFALWVNGIELATDTSGTVPSEGTFNKLDFANFNGSSLPFEGNTKSVAVFKEALTDLELECLVSWMSFSDMGIALGYTVE